jgi:hypothetical protein
MRYHLPDAGVKKRCDGPHGRLHRENRKKCAMAAWPPKPLDSFRKAAIGAKPAQSAAHFLDAEIVCFLGKLAK